MAPRVLLVPRVLLAPKVLLVEWLELESSAAYPAAGPSGSFADQGCPVVPVAAVLQLAAVHLACHYCLHTHIIACGFA